MIVPASTHRRNKLTFFGFMTMVHGLWYECYYGVAQSYSQHYSNYPISSDGKHN